MKDSVVLTDPDDVPLGGEHRRKLLPGENELVIARQLLAKGQRFCHVTGDGSSH
jgi:hypothetical protein